jgi:hypothetical protein
MIKTSGELAACRTTRGGLSLSYGKNCLVLNRWMAWAKQKGHDLSQRFGLRTRTSLRTGAMTKRQKAFQYDLLIELLHDRIALESYYRKKGMPHQVIEDLRYAAFKDVIELMMGIDALPGR